MSASSLLTGLRGVRTCIVADNESRILEHVGAATDAKRAAEAASAVLARINEVSTMLGLGGAEIVTTRAPSAAWIVACDSGFVLAVELDSTQPTAAVEAVLRDSNWSSRVEANLGDSDIEYLPRDESASDTWTGEGPTRQRSAVAESPRNDSGAASPGAAPAQTVVPTGGTSGSRWRKAPQYAPLMVRSSRDTNLVSDGIPQSIRADSREVSSTGVAPAVEHSASASRLLAGSPPAFAGSLETLCLADLLEFLRNGQRTGLLLCRSSLGTGTICVRTGRIVSAGAPGTAHFSAYLVARGGARQEELRARIEERIWLAPVLASVVLARGLATAAHVRAAANQQIRDAVCELLTWSNGEFSFDSDNALLSSSFDPDLAFDHQAILLEIFKGQDEAAKVAT